MSHFREKLALVWSIALILFISVILFEFGDKDGILNHVIDLVKTVVLMLLGFYFGAMYTKSGNDTPPPPSGQDGEAK